MLIMLIIMGRPDPCATCDKFSNLPVSLTLSTISFHSVHDGLAAGTSEG